MPRQEISFLDRGIKEWNPVKQKAMVQGFYGGLELARIAVLKTLERAGQKEAYNLIKTIFDEWGIGVEEDATKVEA